MIATVTIAALPLWFPWINGIREIPQMLSRLLHALDGKDAILKLLIPGNLRIQGGTEKIDDSAMPHKRVLPLMLLHQFWEHFGEFFQVPVDLLAFRVAHGRVPIGLLYI